MVPWFPWFLEFVPGYLEMVPGYPGPWLPRWGPLVPTQVKSDSALSEIFSILAGFDTGRGLQTPLALEIAAQKYARYAACRYTPDCLCEWTARGRSREK